MTHARASEAMEYCRAKWPHLNWTIRQNYLVVGSNDRCAIRLAIGESGAIARLLICGSTMTISGNPTDGGWKGAIAELEEDAKAIASSITPKEEVAHE